MYQEVGKFVQPLGEGSLSEESLARNAKIMGYHNHVIHKLHARICEVVVLSMVYFTPHLPDCIIMPLVTKGQH